MTVRPASMYGLTSVSMWWYLVGRVQAGQGVARDALGQLTAQRADWPAGWFGRDVHIPDDGDEQLRQVVHDGGLTGAARAVDADEQTASMVRKGPELHPRPSWWVAAQRLH